MKIIVLNTDVTQAAVLEFQIDDAAVTFFPMVSMVQILSWPQDILTLALLAKQIMTYYLLPDNVQVVSCMQENCHVKQPQEI